MPFRPRRSRERDRLPELHPYDGPSRRVVGVLGGMGPLATADFFCKVVLRTVVTTESDHLPIAIWSNPEIPDRTRALLGLGPSPVPAMADGVTRLLHMGATAIAVPCNTAHAFFAELEAATGATFLNMVHIAADEVVRKHPRARRVGVLATQGTRLAGLYADAFRMRGVSVVDLPDDLQRRCVDVAIKEVKTGGDRLRAAALLKDAAAALVDRGADVAVAACTEIPLVAHEAARMLPLVDATDCLAAAVVAHCSGTGLVAS
jgi:aspartate racemase